jgi:hypothetical protein
MTADGLCGRGRLAALEDLIDGISGLFLKASRAY